MDFFSRPVINSDGKKIWELVIVNETGTFEYTELVPNNMVNSKELRKRIRKLLDSTSIKPKTIKFFRSQMFNMISIALSDLDLIVKPSRRTFSLLKNLAIREREVYPKMEGFKPFMRDYDVKENLKSFPEKMPDTLQGDIYLFASIDKTAAKTILLNNCNKRCFNSIPFELLLSEKIPGLMIYSERAKALANWLDSLEIYNVQCDIETKNIIIETGLDKKYLFAKISDNQYKEAIFFENEKAKANSVHFISVHSSLDQNENFGFWLLKSD